MKRGGIYQIRNIFNNKIYIGSTISFARREREHKLKLLKNGHYNKYLQNAWNKYGEENFVFEILEEVENISLLTEREQIFLNKFESYKSFNGYNIDSVAKLTTREYEKKQLKKISGENSYTSKLKWQQIKEIRKLFCESNLSVYELASMFETDQSNISRILRNETWIDENYQYKKRCKKGIRRNTKINMEIANKIRNLYSEEKYTYKQISNLYGLSIKCIAQILMNRSWYNKEYEPDKVPRYIKINQKVADSVRERYKNENISLRKLAKEIGVTHSTVFDIIHNKSWRDDK